MKKIFQIFARDMRRLFTNPAAAIVMVGVCVLPSLYAWFNIAANMDPYGNTSNIKVAIATVIPAPVPRRCHWMPEAPSWYAEGK